MSNSLFNLQATIAAADPAQDNIPFPLPLLVAGIVVLFIWIFLRLSHREKFALRRTPGRINTIEPLYIFALLMLWIGATVGATRLFEIIFDVAGEKAEVLGNITGTIVWIAGSLLTAAWSFRSGLRRGMGLSSRHWIFDSLRAVFAYLAVIPICVGLLYLSIQLLPPNLRETHPAIKSIQQMNTAWRAVVVFSLVVMAPLGEEIFFRGLMQSMLRRFLPKPWIAIILTSIMFAFIHWNTPQNIPALFALSIVLGYNYERTGRLWTPIFIHAIFNAISISLVLLYI